MFGRAGAQFSGRRWQSIIAGLFSDRRGVAAVEFALIVPLLLSMYFVTMEVAQAIEANKKVGRVGNMVADLVTQQQKISKSELEAIMTIGEATLQPYNRSKPYDRHHGDRSHQRSDAEGPGGLVAQAGRRQPSASSGSEGTDDHRAAGAEHQGQLS